MHIPIVCFLTDCLPRRQRYLHPLKPEPKTSDVIEMVGFPGWGHMPEKFSPDIYHIVKAQNI